MNEKIIISKEDGEIIMKIPAPGEDRVLVATMDKTAAIRTASELLHYAYSDE